MRPDPAPVPGAGPSAGDISPEVVAIAARRGVSDISAFFRPSLRAAMPDPSSLSGMDEAVARFAAAVRGGERVAVFGDYDVDGATSTALLLRWLRLCGLRDAMFHIPQRLTEGYGPNIPAIEALRAAGATLLVIADSGTGAMAQIARAREIGLDVLVLDHHEPNEDGSLPDAVVVNPKLPSNDGSLSYLCTAGLVFLFLAAANRSLRDSGFFAPPGPPEPKLQNLLGLVALGTVADVVPLKGLNRAYVHLGLSRMHFVPGLAALRDAVNAGREEEKRIGWTAYACGFSFGPCINAGGRISDTTQGTRLLSTDDPGEARAVAEELVALNAVRQEMQREMVARCVENVAADDVAGDDAVIVIHDEAWHPGVVGLGASKVKDHFDRSAVVIGKGGKGSGRAVEGYGMGRSFLRAAERGLLLKGGGHAAAAGLTIDPARIPEFRAFMQEESRGTVRPPTQVDLVVPVGGLGYAAVDDFELLAPFGMGNPRPRVAVTGGVLEDVRLLKEKHVKGRLVTGRHRMDFILFNGAGTPLGEKLRAADGHRVDLLGELSVNEYGGRTCVQIKPTDAMVGAAVTDLAQQAA